jgi:very-short-patch-repair endonuclease
MGRRPRIPPELKKRPFTLDEARAAGVTLDALRRRSWRRIGSELYCWSGLEDDRWRLLVAWRSRLPPDAAFAGLTAAWLHRLDVDPCHPIEVVLPTSSGVRSRMGLGVHRSDLLEVTTARGLPATTIERTFRDLRRRLAPVEVLVLADQALRLRLGRFDELAEPAESPMETRLRWTLLQAGLPRPQVQTELRDSEGRFLGRADLYYPQARLVIEYDGANHRDRLTEDNRRQNSLINARFRILRFTAADQPEAVIALVRRALV